MKPDISFFTLFFKLDDRLQFWEKLIFYLFKRQLSHQLLPEEDHPRDPEEENVVAGLEKRSRIKEFQLVGLVGPPEHWEGEEGGREPSVQHVLVLKKRKIWKTKTFSDFLQTFWWERNQGQQF